MGTLALAESHATQERTVDDHDGKCEYSARAKVCTIPKGTLALAGSHANQE